MLFLVLIAGFTLARRRPVRRSVGLWPRFAALAGLLLLYTLMLLPRAPADPRWDAPALGLLLLGQFFCVVALLQLGRSLSVMPEARRLVTAGLYARIRHPLYLAEAIATLGVLLQFRSVEALAAGGAAVRASSSGACARRRRCWRRRFPTMRPTAAARRD